MQRLVSGIKNFLTDECGGNATSLDKSVFFRTQEGLSYEYGRKFRDQNRSNLGENEFKVNEIPPSGEKRKVMGPIAIHVAY